MVWMRKKLRCKIFSVAAFAWPFTELKYQIRKIELKGPLLKVTSSSFIIKHLVSRQWKLFEGLPWVRWSIYVYEELSILDYKVVLIIPKERYQYVQILQIKLLWTIIAQ